MAGATSIIKSSNFDGVPVGNGSYADATTGWLINGQGRAYFYDATVVGSIDIGGFDSGSFHVDTNGNMWLGAGVFANGTFRVTKEGDAYANSLTTNDLNLKGDTEISDNGKIFLGAGNWNNSDTPFYVDSDSLFSLGTSLVWNGTNLVVRGTLKLEDGSNPINEDDAEEIADAAVDGLENAIYEDGFIGGFTVNSSQMYYGAGNFANQDTAFYVAKNLNTGQANFSLGSKLQWDGTSLKVVGLIEASGGQIGGWNIEANTGRLISATDNQMILSPSENGGAGAIKAAGILIGNGDIVSESVNITSQQEAIYYSGAWTSIPGKSAPGYSFAFVYDASGSGQLWAYIYGANGLEKQYCITQCGTATSSTSSTSTTTTTSNPNNTTTTNPGDNTGTTSTTTTPSPCASPSCAPGAPEAAGWVFQEYVYTIDCGGYGFAKRYTKAGCEFDVKCCDPDYNPFSTTSSSSTSSAPVNCTTAPSYSANSADGGNGWTKSGGLVTRSQNYGGAGCSDCYGSQWQLYTKAGCSDYDLFVGCTFVGCATEAPTTTTTTAAPGGGGGGGGGVSCGGSTCSPGQYCCPIKDGYLCSDNPC